MDNNEVSQASRNDASTMWLLAIFFGFWAPLFYFFKHKNDGFVHDEAKYGLNIGLNIVIATFAVMIVAQILVRIAAFFGIIILLVAVAIWALWLYVVIKNYIAVKNGSPRPALPVPFIMFIK